MELRSRQWLIQTGDIITLDVSNRSLNVNISDEEIAKRKSRLKPFTSVEPRGYVLLYRQHVEQASMGADMDFLIGSSGSEVTKDSH